MYTVTDLCSLCLANSRTMVNILTKDDDGIIVKHKLEYALTEVMNYKPEILKSICTDCLKELNYVYKFKHKCLQNVMSLNDFIEKMTVENEESNYFVSTSEEVPHQMATGDHFLANVTQNDPVQTDELMDTNNLHQNNELQNIVKKEVEDIHDSSLPISNTECNFTTNSIFLDHPNTTTKSNEETEIVKKEPEYLPEEVDIKYDPLLSEDENLIDSSSDEATNNSGKKGISLRKDANSTPNCQTWSKLNCVVKKHNIKTFNEANKIEHHLSKFVDTEDEESYNLAREPPTQQNVTDFNNLIDNQPAVVEIHNNNKEVFYCTKAATATNNTATLSMPIHITTTSEDASAEASTHLIQNTCTNDNIIIAMDEQATLPSNFEIHKKLQLILKEQQQMRIDISAFHVKFDKLLDVLIKKSSTTPNNDLQNSDDLLDNVFGKMLPLSSEQNIHELEAQLQEKEFEAAFVKYMSKVGGTAGNKNASKIAYMVMDTVFERALLIQCSWTGSTKKKDVKKISFLRFTRVIDALFKIINLADSRYTVKDNDDFLRRILKNSVSRNNQVKAAHQRKAAHNPQVTTEITDIDKTNDAFLEVTVFNRDNLDDIESND